MIVSYRAALLSSDKLLESCHIAPGVRFVLKKEASH